MHISILLSTTINNHQWSLPDRQFTTIAPYCSYITITLKIRSRSQIPFTGLIEYLTHNNPPVHSYNNWQCPSWGYITMTLETRSRSWTSDMCILHYQINNMLYYLTSDLCVCCIALLVTPSLCVSAEAVCGAWRGSTEEWEPDVSQPS